MVARVSHHKIILTAVVPAFMFDLFLLHLDAFFTFEHCSGFRHSFVSNPVERPHTPTPHSHPTHTPHKTILYPPSRPPPPPTCPLSFSFAFSLSCSHTSTPLFIHPRHTPFTHLTLPNTPVHTPLTNLSHSEYTFTHPPTTHTHLSDPLQRTLTHLHTPAHSFHELITITVFPPYFFSTHLPRLFVFCLSGSPSDEVLDVL